MRIFFLLVLISSIVRPALSQSPQKNMSKQEMQHQIAGPIKELNNQIADLEKQIAEAKKNKGDSESLKEMEDELAMLKKQLALMEGVNKNLSNMSDKTIQQANEEEPLVPKKDVTRISMLPKKILNDAELLLFIKNVHSGVEKLIPIAERTEALSIYNETKTQYRSTSVVANAASGCWMIGHWEKALFIMGKACLDDLSNADNLNNYAAFLIMTGGEQAAIPILEYLNSKYVNNSTILNNLGQAWFGLGDIDKAKEKLDETTALYPNHSMANSILSNISRAEGNNEKAISLLKESLKDTYDPEKEAELNKLGYEIKYEDMPPFNYPMKKDPLGLIPLLNSWPENIQSSVDDDKSALALQRYLKGASNLTQELDDENQELDKEIKEDEKKLLTDPAFRSEYLEPFNCPAYLQAGRSIQLLTIEEAESNSSLGAQLLFPFIKNNTGPEKNNLPLSTLKILRECQKLWTDSVAVPTMLLQQAMIANATNNSGEINCKDADAKTNAFLAKRWEIYHNGVKLIKNKFTNKSKQLDDWIKLSLYGSLGGPPHSVDDLTYALIGEMQRTKGRRLFRNKNLDWLLILIHGANEFEGRYRSACIKDPASDPDPDGDDLAPLIVKEVKCEYIKKIITPRIYTFTLQCNTIIDKTDSKLKKRKSDVPKGSAQNSKLNYKRDIEGPLRQIFRKGPNNSHDEANEEQIADLPAPLCAEDKDPSYFSLEYNKSGNLVGFNFQLNEDGTTLKDPDSVESGVDSRWSWNAIASSKKGYLNKLLIK